MKNVYYLAVKNLNWDALGLKGNGIVVEKLHIE